MDQKRPNPALLALLGIVIVGVGVFLVVQKQRQAAEAERRAEQQALAAQAEAERQRPLREREKLLSDFLSDGQWGDYRERWRPQDMVALGAIHGLTHSLDPDSGEVVWDAPNKKLFRQLLLQNTCPAMEEAYSRPEGDEFERREKVKVLKEAWGQCTRAIRELSALYEGASGLTRANVLGVDEYDFAKQTLGIRVALWIPNAGRSNGVVVALGRNPCDKPTNVLIGWGGFPGLRFMAKKASGSYGSASWAAAAMQADSEPAQAHITIDVPESKAKAMKQMLGDESRRRYVEILFRFQPLATTDASCDDQGLGPTGEVIAARLVVEGDDGFKDDWQIVSPM